MMNDFKDHHYLFSLRNDQYLIKLRIEKKEPEHQLKLFHIQKKVILPKKKSHII